MSPLSPIALKQRALYGMDPVFHRLTMTGPHRRVIPARAGLRLGYFGIAANPQAGTSVYSGPPIGQGSGKGAATGAMQGASVGAVAGPIGMAIGAVIGAVGGAIAGALGKRDPEQANFDQAVAIYRANPNGVLALVNKYLPLAGMFDLKIKSGVPIYSKYGRMGEQKFLTDMAMLIYNAAQSGQITASDTPQTIMVRVVQPWIDSWGFGPMSSPNAGMVNMLLMGLIIDYVTGQEHNWLARGGQYPFTSLPAFKLPTAMAQPPPGSAAAQPPAARPPQPPFPGNATAQPSQPPVGTVLTADGSVITPGSNTSLQAQGHTFTFGTAPGPGGMAVYIDGRWDGTGGGTGLGLLNGQVYLQNKQGNWYAWTANGWTGTSGPNQAPPPAQGLINTSGPSTTAVPIPAGFAVSGTDSATGLPVYSTPNGGYFTWTGTNMTPFTGVLTSGLSIQAGLALAGTAAQGASNLPALNTGGQQLFNSAAAPDMPPPQPSQTAPPAAPGQSVSTAGISGLPSWVSWGAVAGVAVLMFATARPVGRVKARGRFKGR